MSDPVMVARASLARVSRKKGYDPDKVRAAKQRLNAAMLERHIRETLASAPPISVEQRSRLADVLRAGGGEDG